MGHGRSPQTKRRRIRAAALACTGAAGLWHMSGGDAFVGGFGSAQRPLTGARGIPKTTVRAAADLAILKESGHKASSMKVPDGKLDETRSGNATIRSSMGPAGVAVAAVAGLAVRLARSFVSALPRRRSVATACNNGEKRQGLGSAGGFAAPVSGGIGMSSRSSGFLGSSMAGSITSVQAPRPNARLSSLSSMNMIFEKYSEKAIKAVMMSQEEARRTGIAYVCTEMLLVGVVGEGTSFAAKLLLKDCGVDMRKARAALDKVVGQGTESQQKSEVPFTSEAKAILAVANEEAKNIGDQNIDPSHLMLAILQAKEPGLTKFLAELEINPDEVRAKILKELQEQVVKESESSERAASRDKGSGKPGNSLADFGRDLTKIAAEGGVDPLVGREEELDRMIQILARRQKNNPVLIGEPGVGKTAIAEGLAQRIATGDVPDILQGKRIIMLDLGNVLSGTKFRGEFEERLNNIIKECMASKGEIILMIDEIHTIVGAGGGGDGGGAMDAANIIKPALSRGDLQVIGATTIEEYRKHVERDKALERRFQPITVPEPTVEEAIAILTGLVRKYEAHHRLRYTDEALQSCVKFASQYIQDRFLPDKAIDLMDEAGAKVQLRTSAKVPDAAKNLLRELRAIQDEKEAAVRKQDFAAARELRNKEDKKQEELRQTMKDEMAVAQAAQDEQDPAISESMFEEAEVTENDVAGVVAAWTGVPVNKVTADESSRLVALEETLHNRVIGQEEAVVAVSKAVRRARAGLKNPNRPIASFIFCGPTGVGKTELCKALAAAYFGKEDAMIRLDMSEFMEKHTVSKLIGSPPGYVGYDEESQLTDGVRRRPYTLVLFDEVEKAHPDVFNLLLQVLEDGRLTDSKGRTVSFKNTLIIMTSNCGAKEIEKELLGGGNLGFSGMEEKQGASSYQRLKSLVHEQLKGFFRPEFINRLDEVIVFKSLTKAEVTEIAELEFNKTIKRCEEKGVKLTLSDRFKKKVVDEGFNPVYGARPLRRAVMRLLEDSLAESFLTATPAEGDRVMADLDKDGKVVILRQLSVKQPEQLEGGEEVPQIPVQSQVA